MKKILPLILALIMMLAVLASCTNEPAETDDPESESEEVTETEKVLSEVSAFEIICFLTPKTTFASTFGCTEYLFDEVESKDDFIAKFTDEDFTVLNTTPVAGAKFETITLNKKDELVTIYWNEAESNIRLLYEIIDEKVLALLKSNTMSGSGALTFAQIGTERVNETDNPLIGMCYVIKLASGKAIVIDGGFPNEPCADNLFNSLGKMGIAKNAEGQFMIEAWFFSHGHGDHKGVMTYYSEKYGDKTDVEYFLYNMPSTADVAGFHGGEKRFHDLCRAAFPDSVFVVPHAGIKYYFGNAIIDMLYTPDLVWSPATPITEYNSTSLIFKLQGGGASFFCCGDTGEPASESLWNHYDSSAFKSDILQITHHGLTTGGGQNGQEWEYLKKVYDATEATYAVLPMHSRYKTGNERNGRYTVLIQWCNAGYQSSYVMNESDNHGLSSFNQNYYNDFCDSVREGKNTKETLYGYDGINKAVNENGLVTYLGGNEYKPMVTIFSFANNKVTLVENQELYSWLEA